MRKRALDEQSLWMAPSRGPLFKESQMLLLRYAIVTLIIGLLLASDVKANSLSQSRLVLQPVATNGQPVQVPKLSATANSSEVTVQPPYFAIGRKITKILNDFFEKGYDKRVRPNYGGLPVTVNVTMRILSISSVSEVQMDFTADFYFRQTWVDPRLRFLRTGDIHRLYVGAEVSDKIWIPDTFFGNEKVAYFHMATTPNVFLRIDHSGEVYRSIRLTVTSSCPMKLQYFPMDRQRCTIEAESYGYDVKDIKYDWAGVHAVERDKTISLPQFDIIGIEQKSRTEILSSGTYSRLVAEIHFARRMGYYLIQMYIPSSLIVVISWVSFWLHRNASPARVQLGVTTVLTMTTLMSSTNSALPKISYVKSIDVFLGTCFVMVFSALIEYATVGYLGKRIAMRKAHAQSVLTHAVAMTQRMAAVRNQKPAAIMSPVPINQFGYATNQNLTTTGKPVAPTTAHQDSLPTHPTQLISHSVTNQPHFTTTNSAQTGINSRPAQSNVVEQFLNTAATLSNIIGSSPDKKQNPLLNTSRLVDGKQLGKSKHLESIFGVRPSSIDKYSRVVFPVCFVCFQLMYWIVYLHISSFLDVES